MANGMIMGDCLQNDSFQFVEQIASPAEPVNGK